MARERRQFVRFAFYHVDSAWRRLPSDERRDACLEFAQLVDDWAGKILLRTYSTIGTRGDCDFLLWQVSENLDDINQLAADINGTALSSYLSTPYSYLSMTKHSMYVSEHVHPGQEGTRLTVAPEDADSIFW